MRDIMLTDAQVPHELTPLFVGHEACESGHTFGPYVRGYYLLHFCLGGCGILKNRHGEHAVHAGQLFVIRPGELTTYAADLSTPWEYVWIAFRGQAATAFDAERSVYDTPHELEQKLSEAVLCGIESSEIYMSILFELIFRLFREPRQDRATDRIRLVHRYIQYHYMMPLTVEALAHSFGFERSHLYRVFKDRYGIGVKQYIIKVRMRCARDFLSRGCTVGECAHMVGYEDEFNFSKAFKKHFGISPSSVCRGS